MKECLIFHLWWSIHSASRLKRSLWAGRGKPLSLRKWMKLTRLRKAKVPTPIHIPTPSIKCWGEKILSPILQVMLGACKACWELHGCSLYESSPILEWTFNWSIWHWVSHTPVSNLSPVWLQAIPLNSASSSLSWSCIRLFLQSVAGILPGVNKHLLISLQEEPHSTPGTPARTDRTKEELRRRDCVALAMDGESESCEDGASSRLS